ncbi:hypothetical protein Ancab_022485 [Ancistrocladus abbreviatus]
MAEVVFFVDDLQPASAISQYCRICHEEEFENWKSLEAPCACSGTVKFAHRECIQRWCDEKGDTTCEICLQKYEPGYTVRPKKSQLMEDEEMTIRGSLAVPRRGQELEDPALVAIAEGTVLGSDYSDYSSAIDRGASCCRTVALLLTYLLLVKHLLAVVIGGAGHHPFSALTVLIFRVCGIFLPMCIIIRAITAVQNSIRRHQHLYQASPDDNRLHSRENEEQQQLHHRIDIQSQ